MENRPTTWPIAVATLAIWLFLFWPFLLGQSCFGYRDTAYLYYPLWEWVQHEWTCGEVPLWSPLDDFGSPVLADGVGAIFYPLKAIFFVPFLPYAAKLGTFVALHVLIAAVGAYWLGRVLRLSPTPAALAAAAYALSGTVLFQTANAVYLVGAAWLPSALAAGWSIHKGGGQRNVVWTATFVALMVLGGDPQAAYHALLILGASSLAKAFVMRARFRGFSVRRISEGLARFLAIGLLAAGLSAVQWLPTWAWHQRSARANPSVPHSAWESLECGLDGRRLECSGWFGRAKPNTHQYHIYQFSQAPWSLIELFCPNVSGSEFPTFRRWTSAFPAADRVWTPSIYFGLGVALLAIGGLRFRRGSLPVVGLSWLALVFCFGSFGWYGLGWMARELGWLIGANTADVSPPLFGVYWWLATFLPGYDSFRYPAKLFVVATLAASLLAGFQLQRLRPDAAARFCVWLVALLLASLVLLALSYWPGMAEWGSSLPGDSTFGPFDGPAALADLRWAFVHSAVVSAALWWIVRQLARSRGVWRPWREMFLTLTIVELLVANSWLIVGVSAGEFSRHSAATHSSPAVRQLRIRRPLLDVGQPGHWATSSSPSRIQELLRFQRDTLFPKFHLEHGVDLIGSYRALEPLDLEWFSEFADDRYDGLLGIAGRLRLDSSFDGQSFPSEPDDSARFEPIHSVSLAGFVEHWTPPSFARDSRIRADQKDVFVTAVRDDLTVLAQDRPGWNLPTAQLVRQTSRCVDWLIECPKPAWFVVFNYWDAGWRVDIMERGTGRHVSCRPVRFAGIFQAIHIPREGTFQVRFAYQPLTFYWGAVISGTSLLVTGGFLAFRWARK